MLKVKVRSVIAVTMVIIMLLTLLPVSHVSADSDLAVNQPVTASSIEAVGFEASKAVDGDGATRWSSQFSDSQWIYVDLGACKNITGVKMIWDVAYGKTYKIQTSNDAANWTDIYSTTTGDGGTDELTGLSGSGRYVRMYGTERGSSWGYSLHCFEVYGSELTSIRIEAEAMNASYSVANYGSTIGGINNGSWICFNNVNLGSGYNKLRARYANGNGGLTSNAEIRLDSLIGTLVGTFSASDTGGWNNWTEGIASISGASGIHNIYIEFSSASDYDWFQFDMNTPTPTPTPTPLLPIRLEAETMNSSYSVANFGAKIGGISNGSWVCFNNVNLGSGYNTFTARYWNGNTSHLTSSAEIRLDRLTGPIIGTFSSPSTGWWDFATDVKVPLVGASGTHNIYIRFSRAADYDWFQFETTVQEPTNIFDPYLNDVPNVVSVVSDTLVENGTVRVKKFVFHSQTIDGIDQNVYSIIARPEASGNYPGILQLHGGQGYAEELTPQLIEWAKRGYIAETLDFPGWASRDPNNPTTDNTRYSTGPWKSHEYGWGSWDMNSLEGNTTFGSMVAGLQTFNLLKSQPGVIQNRIGITGISMGGYSTTMLSGLLGDKVYAAYSIYGCGYYDLGSTFILNMETLSPVDRAAWLQNFDAGRRAHDIRANYYIAAATDDHYFWPEAVNATLKEIPGSKNHVFAPNADHNLLSLPGSSQNAYVFMDYNLKGTEKPIPVVNIESFGLTPGGDGSKTAVFNVSVDASLTLPSGSTKLYYNQTGNSFDWTEVVATSLGNNRFSVVVPASAVSANADWLIISSDNRPITGGSLVYSSSFNIN